MSIPGTYIKSEKLSLTRWTPSLSSTKVNKKTLRTAKFDFESICVQEETKTQRQQRG